MGPSPKGENFLFIEYQPDGRTVAHPTPELQQIRFAIRSPSPSPSPPPSPQPLPPATPTAKHTMGQTMPPTPPPFGFSFLWKQQAPCATVAAENACAAPVWMDCPKVPSKRWRSRDTILAQPPRKHTSVYEKVQAMGDVDSLGSLRRAAQKWTMDPSTLSKMMKTGPKSTLKRKKIGQAWAHSTSTEAVAVPCCGGTLAFLALGRRAKRLLVTKNMVLGKAF